METESKEKTLKTYTIEKVEDLGDGYFVSSVYVFHPFEITGNGSGSVFVGLILGALGFATVALCICLCKKSKSKIEQR